jgi:hypothetical protein
MRIRINRQGRQERQGGRYKEKYPRISCLFYLGVLGVLAVQFSSHFVYFPLRLTNAKIPGSDFVCDRQ